jgi:hypothetical protein
MATQDAVTRNHVHEGIVRALFAEKAVDGDQKQLEELAAQSA